MERIILTNQLLDRAIFELAKRPAGLYDLNMRQAEIVKAAWDGLHLYDKEFFYTFVGEYRLEKRSKSAHDISVTSKPLNR